MQQLMWQPDLLQVATECKKGGCKYVSHRLSMIHPYDKRQHNKRKEPRPGDAGMVKVQTNGPNHE